MEQINPELRKSSAEMVSPIYAFPGDEVIDAESYRDSIVKGYVSAMATFSGTASSCSLDLDAETFERWKRGLSAMDYLDDTLDEAPELDKGQSAYLEMLDYLRGDGVLPNAPDWVDEDRSLSLVLLKNAITGIDEDKIDAFFDASEDISQIAVRKKHSRDVGEYARILEDEARITAEIFLTSSSYHVYSQPEYKEFSQWMHDAMRLANYMYSACDLYGDYKNGRTSLEATPRNIGKIASFAGKSAVKVLHPRDVRRTTQTAILKYSRFQGRTPSTWFNK